MDDGWSEPGRLSIAALVTDRVRQERPRAYLEIPSFIPGIFPTSFYISCSKSIIGETSPVPNPKIPKPQTRGLGLSQDFIYC